MIFGSEHDFSPLPLSRKSYGSFLLSYNYIIVIASQDSHQSSVVVQIVTHGERHPSGF